MAWWRSQNFLSRRNISKYLTGGLMEQGHILHGGRKKGKERNEEDPPPKEQYVPEDITGGSSTTNNGQQRGRRLWCSHLQGEPTQKARGSGGGCCYEKCQEKEEGFVHCNFNSTSCNFNSDEFRCCS